LPDVGLITAETIKDLTDAALRPAAIMLAAFTCFAAARAEASKSHADIR
jgi:hypothetical protein